MKKVILLMAILLCSLATYKVKAQLGLSKKQIINAYGNKPNTKMEIKDTIENGKKWTTITLNFLKTPGVYEAYTLDENDVCKSVVLNCVNFQQVEKVKSYLSKHYVKAPNNRLWIREEGPYIHMFYLVNPYQFYESKTLKKD